jgi:hypothetical protein
MHSLALPSWTVRISIIAVMVIGLVALMSGSASAGIGPVTGYAVVQPMPGNLVVNVHQSNYAIRTYDEGSATLTSPLHVDITATGTTTTGFGSLVGTNVAAGHTVNSHLLHFDPSITLTRSGTVWFPGETIIGLIVNNGGTDSLEDSDAIFSPATTFSTTLGSRGLENTGDSVTLAGTRKSVTVTMTVSTSQDQIRVITVDDTKSATKAKGKKN